MTLLSVFILCVSVCLGFINTDQLSVKGIQVSAAVSSTVVLPCEWRDPSIQTPYVEWTIGPDTVFERQGKESIAGEGYEGRVDVPEDELLKGNCSLVLKNVRVTDEAEYRSSMLVTNTKEPVLVQKVQLSVYTEERTDENTSSSDGTEVTPDSSDNDVKNLHYLWFLIILPAVVLLGLGVWLLKRKKIIYLKTEHTEEEEPKEMNRHDNTTAPTMLPTSLEET